MTGVEARAVAGDLGAVADEQSPVGETIATRGSDKNGRSSSTTNPNGTVSYSIDWPVRAGTKLSERRACETLAQRLGQEGVRLGPIEELPQDNRADCKATKEDGSDFEMQVVSPMNLSRFWRDLRQHGRAEGFGAPEDLAALIRSTIEHKASPHFAAIRPHVVLVIDADQLSALTYAPVIAAYRRVQGDPVREFRFRDVWIVGPTAESCRRLS